MSPTSRENRCGAEVLAGEGRMEVMNFVDVWEGDTPLLHEGGSILQDADLFSDLVLCFLSLRRKQGWKVEPRVTSFQ